MVSVLSTEECSTILKKYLKTVNFKIVTYEIEPLTESLNGLIGQHYTLTVKYTLHDNIEKQQEFFIKALNDTNKIMYEISKDNFLYEKEEFYYTFLLPEFEYRGIDVGYAPRCYMCKNDTVTLENVSLSGFRSTSKQKPLDFEHCTCGLETLAKFHVSAIIYKIVKSKDTGLDYNFYQEHQKYLKDVLFGSGDTSAKKYMQCSIEGLCLLIDIIPEANGITKHNFKNKLMAVINEMLNSSIDNNFTCTVLHGDLWSNNFLFKYKEGKPVESKLIDFQTIKYGPPGVDVLLFIYTNTRKEFRDEHMEELISHHNRCYNELLFERGLEQYSLSLGEQSKICNIYKIPIKIQSIVDRCITFLSDENFKEAMKSDDTFSKFLFEDRGKYILDSFNNNTKFRELILEDVLELRQFLFEEE